jgi:DNA primase
MSIREHMMQVQGHLTARFLSSEFEIIKESQVGELETTIEGLNGDVAGLVVDGTIDQKILDLLASRGLEYVAAKDFSGIIKKPVSVRLLKLP